MCNFLACKSVKLLLFHVTLSLFIPTLTVLCKSQRPHFIYLISTQQKSRNYIFNRKLYFQSFIFVCFFFIIWQLHILSFPQPIVSHSRMRDRNTCRFVELHFLLSLEDGSFKYCLPNDNRFCGVPGLAWLLRVPVILFIFWTPVLETSTYFP